MITDIQFHRDFDSFHFQECHQKPPTFPIWQFNKVREEASRIEDSPNEAPCKETSNKDAYNSHVLFSSTGLSNYNEQTTTWSSKYSLSLDDELKKVLAVHEPNFYECLLFYMHAKHITDETELYKKAEVDRKVFSKIRSMRKTNHRPSKPTALKLCLALELTSQQTQEMLNTVGYGMSNASMVDKIIMFFIEHDDFDIFKIDEKIREITEQRYLIENL